MRLNLTAAHVSPWNGRLFQLGPRDCIREKQNFEQSNGFIPGLRFKSKRHA
jgi:hypothetical protein